jgi:hypothetical protein
MLEGSTGVNHIPPVGIYTHMHGARTHAYILCAACIPVFTCLHTRAYVQDLSVGILSLCVSLYITVYNYTYVHTELRVCVCVCVCVCVHMHANWRFLACVQNG